MGQSKNNLFPREIPKIKTITVLGSICLLISSLQSVIGIEAITLETDLITLTEFKPNRSLSLEENNQSQRFIITKDLIKLNFRIAVHLKECNFGGKNGNSATAAEEEWIELQTKTGSIKWTCNDSKGGFKPFKFEPRHASENYITVAEVIDDLEEVLITAHFREDDLDSNTKIKSSKSTALIIVNIYKEASSDEKNCPKHYFNCRAPLCKSCCCSEQQNCYGNNYNGGNSMYMKSNYEEQEKDNFFNLLSFSIMSGRSRSKIDKSGPRCIHESLVCDGNPNCGMEKSVDEANEVCLKSYCPCQNFCITWNYILTSLAIAVLFIITPTAIVFALFHRRNVALERERLIRLAQARMMEMRGEFVRDSPANDLPPSYEDIYDSKEPPPPCFCQAVGVMQYNLEQVEEEVESGARSCSCSFANQNSSSSSNDIIVSEEDNPERIRGRLRNSNSPSSSPPQAEAVVVRSETPDEIAIDAVQTIANGNPSRENSNNNSESDKV